MLLSQRRIRAFLTIVLVLCMLAGMCSAAHAETMRERYDNAVELVAAGKYDQALSLLKTFGNYEDSTRLTMYCGAVVAAENAEFSKARQIFDNLGDG